MTLQRHGPDNHIREETDFWAVSDLDTGYAVRRVHAFRCWPHTSAYWWCPEVGFSMQEGVSLFKSENNALDKALGLLRDHIHALERQVMEYQARRYPVAPRAK